MPARLFISYRRSRKAAVLAAKAALEAAGIAVWLDLEDIDPLADFPGRIRQGIAESHAVLIWWSADYAESDICLQELRLAWQHTRRHSSDIARRVWVLNPETSGGHIFAGELNSSNFLAPPPPGSEAAWAESLRKRLDALLPEGPLADERHAESTPPIHGAPTPSREFTGRGAELMRIHSALFPPRVGPAAAGVAVQIHGLGGLGKTELAAKYVADFATAYPAGVLWLNLAPWQPARPATEADAQAAWLRALDAALVHAPELWRSLALDPEGKARPAPEVRERLARHLDNEKPCLVVLDNLPELSPTDVRARILAFLAAPGPQGKTLVTTRDARPAEGYTALGLDVLGPDDALRLLARYRPAPGTAERAAMEALVAEVGGHTQALGLLGERYREDPSGYPRALATLREQGQLPRIEALAEQLTDELGTRARGIVATFAISIEPLPEPTRHLLGLASVCAPNTPIPDGLLALAFGGEAREDDFARALAALLRASLLGRHGEDDALRIHPLAAQAALALLQPDREALEAAVAVALSKRLAVLGDDESQARFLAAEAAQATHVAPHHPSQTGVLLWLWVGRYETARGAFTPARAAEEAALALGTEVLGEDHPDTLLAMNNLALTLRAQGEFAGARALQESALAAHHRVLGETHRDTLNLKNNFAETLRLQGDLASAQALQASMLEARRRDLGEEHPDTLMTMNNLALTLFALGDLAGARALQESELAISRRVRGDDHPETLTSMNNLASTLREQGDLAGARKLQEAVLAAQRASSGEEHPATLCSMNNLALTCQAEGDLAGARALQVAVLAASRKVLGEDHPRTLVSIGNLATTLSAQGDLAGAQALQESALTANRRLLGEDHPDTLRAMSNLASTLLARGEAADARPLLEAVVAAQRRVLGEDHPHTLGSINNLADTLRALGDLADARTLHESALAAYRRTLGADHPDTLTVMSNLASTLRAQGDLAGARVQRESVLEARLRVLGEEHPDTSISAWNLLYTLIQLGDIDTARTVLNDHLRWLAGRDPASLGADQRTIRGYVRETLRLTSDD